MNKFIVKAGFLLGLCGALAFVVYAQLAGTKAALPVAKVEVTLPAANCLQCHLERGEVKELPLEGG